MICIKKVLRGDEMDYKTRDHVGSIFAHMKENTKKTYVTTIRKYEKFHGLSFNELIEEALNEQEEGIPEHRLKIYDRIMSFRDWLIDNYKFATVSQDYTRVKTIYKRSRVKLPYFPPIERKQCQHNPIIDYWEVLSKDEIREALEWFRPNMRARIMTMATGGYSLEETATMTIRQFLTDLWEYHQSENPHQAMTILSMQDNIVWMTKMMRVKTGKHYYGICNPESVQAIAQSWVNRDIDNLDAPLFRQTKQWVTKHMGEINDVLGLGEAGGFRRFTPHSLRRYNATNLSGASLSQKEEMQINMIDEIQGRAMSDVQDRYIKTNPIKQKLMYVKVMNNVSLFNQYTYEIFNGDVVVHRVDPTKKVEKLTHENEILKNKLENQNKADEELKKYIEVVGKDNFEKRVLKLLQEM